MDQQPPTYDDAPPTYHDVALQSWWKRLISWFMSADVNQNTRPPLYNRFAMCNYVTDSELCREEYWRRENEPMSNVAKIYYVYRFKKHCYNRFGTTIAYPNHSSLMEITRARHRIPQVNDIFIHNDWFNVGIVYVKPGTDSRNIEFIEEMYMPRYGMEAGFNMRDVIAHNAKMFEEETTMLICDVDRALNYHDAKTLQEHVRRVRPSDGHTLIWKYPVLISNSHLIDNGIVIVG